MSSDIERFEIEALDEHNRCRALHGCPPLTLNKHLCSYATEWAQNLARRNIMQHRSNLQYGENIYMAGGSGIDVNGRTAVIAWYKEIHNYGFGHGQFAMNTGHFTQVVWKDTTEMGIGFAKSGSSIWVVANYSPPGNYQGRFYENVPRLI